MPGVHTWFDSHLVLFQIQPSKLRLLNRMVEPGLNRDSSRSSTYVNCTCVDSFPTNSRRAREVVFVGNLSEPCEGFVQSSMQRMVMTSSLRYTFPT